jgi:hypothetical protein
MRLVLSSMGGKAKWRRVYSKPERPAAAKWGHCIARVAM